jgi:hypothetical protein
MAIILETDEFERLRTDAARYRFLRAKSLDTIGQGGVFAGMTPQNLVLNGADLDVAIDSAMKDATAVANGGRTP